MRYKVISFQQETVSLEFSRPSQWLKLFGGQSEGLSYYHLLSLHERGIEVPSDIPINPAMLIMAFGELYTGLASAAGRHFMTAPHSGLTALDWLRTRLADQPVTSRTATFTYGDVGLAFGHNPAYHYMKRDVSLTVKGAFDFAEIIHIAPRVLEVLDGTQQHYYDGKKYALSRDNISQVVIDMDADTATIRRNGKRLEISAAALALLDGRSLDQVMTEHSVQKKKKFLITLGLTPE